MGTVNFVLIHSPLVGPYTWALVAGELRRRGYPVIVPELSSPPESSRPYWELHAAAVAQAVQKVPSGAPLLLAAHSGAGPILPAIRQAVHNPIAGYLFVDAGWPENDKSRLELFGDPLQVERFRRSLAGGFIPVWSDADLQEVIPDAEIRRRFASELRPLPVAVYDEPLPVFAGWPDAPGGYLRFGDNPAYETPGQMARRMSFAYRELAGEHFHMLVKPREVAETILELVKEMGKAVHE